MNRIEHAHRIRFLDDPGVAEHLREKYNKEYLLAIEAGHPPGLARQIALNVIAFGQDTE